MYLSIVAFDIPRNSANSTLLFDFSSSCTFNSISFGELLLSSTFSISASGFLHISVLGLGAFGNPNLHVPIHLQYAECAWVCTFIAKSLTS